MKHAIKEYKEKLEKGLKDYMSLPMSERSASAVESMVECWEHISEMEKMLDKRASALTDEKLEHWNAKIINDNGTVGGHWSVQDTTAVAESCGVNFDHITPKEWNVAMNMIYSDYCNVASKWGVSVPEFYADMAKAFLFDKDGKKPSEKLALYYCYVVE